MRRAVFAAAAAALVLAGCSTLGDIGASVGEATGHLSAEQGQAIRQGAQAVEESQRDFTPEEEYYVGRTVGAVVLSQYRPYDSPRVNDYLNLLGRSLSLVSDRPETYGGYHFLALDTDEINALSAPGGLVFVSRGLLRCATSEDEAAAILAHEIGHVVARHGMQAIQKSHRTAALVQIAKVALGSVSPGDKQLFGAFADSIGDITSTLINKGYSRQSEYEADRLAAGILERSGYDPRALVRMLRTMETRLKPGGAGFAKTHPDPADRIKALEPVLASAKSPSAAAPPERQRRFQAALGSI